MNAATAQQPNSAEATLRTYCSRQSTANTVNTADNSLQPKPNRQSISQCATEWHSDSSYACILLRYDFPLTVRGEPALVAWGYDEMSRAETMHDQAHALSTAQSVDGATIHTIVVMQLS